MQSFIPEEQNPLPRISGSSQIREINRHKFRSYRTLLVYTIGQLLIPYISIGTFIEMYGTKILILNSVQNSLFIYC